MCVHISFERGGGWVCILELVTVRSRHPQRENKQTPIRIYLMIFQNGYGQYTPLSLICIRIGCPLWGHIHSSTVQQDGTVWKIVNDTTRVRLLLTSISRWKSLNNTTVPSWFALICSINSIRPPSADGKRRRWCPLHAGQSAAESSTTNGRKWRHR
jgi:hypothetical protein